MKARKILSAALALAMMGSLSGDFFGIATAIAASAETYGTLEYEIKDDGTIEITDCDGTGSSVNIPSEIDGKPVTGIGESAFSDCKDLTDIEIPDSVTNIGYFAFDYCTSLTDITLPDSVTDIGHGAFYGCTSLTDISIPDSITDISVDTFRLCENLTTISIPDSVETIEYGAFYGCPSLTDVYYAGTQEQWIHIDIEKENNCLLKANIHCSDSPSDKISISEAYVIVPNKTYTGKALKPAPTVKLNDRILKKSTDYTVSYKNNVKCGKATVTVTGKGDYTGTKSGSFIIKPKKVTAKKLTSPKTRTVKLTWTKAAGGVTGYEVQIAANSKFTKGKKSVTVAKASATSKTVTKLKKGTRYFARVRAYKTVGKTKYYGAWSTAKKVKCK
ncbi:MAG: fibronectin type III domain-containing protein [Ruminococcus sp.]|nr:fibronectin type III domain-containing protein [Ruminococcus sp.]